jgi:hypothetical protein
MKGLAVGRTVLYVLKNGEQRPMTVVKILPTMGDVENMINGVVMLDGSNDVPHLPFELRPEQFEVSTVPTVWLTQVPYDEAGTKPGTWVAPFITKEEPKEEVKAESAAPAGETGGTGELPQS